MKLLRMYDDGRVNEAASIPISGRETVGRGHGASLRLRRPDVSRRHAELRVHGPNSEPDGEGGAGVTVTDLGSTNGTFVNGERLQPGAAVRAQAGDILRVASLRFLLAHSSQKAGEGAGA